MIRTPPGFAVAYWRKEAWPPRSESLTVVEKSAAALLMNFKFARSKTDFLDRPAQRGAELAFEFRSGSRVEAAGQFAR